MTTHSVSSTAELTAILASAAVLPGDIIELDDGTYAGDFTSTIAGTDIAPIIIRPVNPGEVTIDGTLTISNDYTHWYDLDFTDSNTDRHDYAGNLGIYMTHIGTHMHGCRITDLHNSGINWYGSGVGEVSECVIYNNGYRELDDSGHGHGIYSHNNGGGDRLIKRNILGYQLGDYALHIYSGGANWLKDYKVYDNCTNSHPTHTGGGLGLVNFDYQRNIHYVGLSQHGQYSPAGSNDNGIISNNYFIDHASYYVNPDWANLTEADNEVYGGEPAARAGYTVIAQPATKTWVTAFTESARWLGMVTIFNRDSAATVNVDLSSILSPGVYRLRNGQNMTETWDFIHYDGVATSVPMTTWTASTMIGVGPGDNQLPVFGSFVIENSEAHLVDMNIIGGYKMTTLNVFTKDPSAVLDYKFDWAALSNGSGDTDWLANTEEITSATITITPSVAVTGLIKDSQSLTDSNTSVTVWLSSGTDNVNYTVACKIVTNGLRTDERTITICVRNR